MEMKTAISVPDDIYREAEVFAKHNRISRSALYSMAVRAYIEQRRPEETLRALNAVYARESSELDPLLSAAQLASVSSEDWP